MPPLWLHPENAIILGDRGEGNGVMPMITFFKDIVHRRGQMKTSEVVFATCDAQIGYQSRRITLGPEYDLVRAFLQSGLDGSGYSFHFDQLAVFIEPRIDSGFPDIVLAEFRPGFYDRWVDARSELTSSELKMLSLLYSLKAADFSRVRAAMRLSASSVAKSLELLYDAELIERDRFARKWKPLPLTETFGIKRLIAVEAKVCNNYEVLSQAALNRWFASESYALTPNKPNAMFVERAKRAGVGMVSLTRQKTFRRCVKSRRFALPSSYASWQFNEWIGRRLSAERALT